MADSDFAVMTDDYDNLISVCVKNDRQCNKANYSDDYDDERRHFSLPISFHCGSCYMPDSGCLCE